MPLHPADIALPDGTRPTGTVHPGILHAPNLGGAEYSVALNIDTRDPDTRTRIAITPDTARALAAELVQLADVVDRQQTSPPLACAGDCESRLHSVYQK